MISMTGATRKKRVLVVDDDSISLTLVSRCFSRSAPELDVETCLGSKEAVDAICREDVDIVLLDINMPGLNGFEVLERARDRATFGHYPPIVMLSTSNSAKDISTAYTKGAAAYVVKPSGLDEYDKLARSVSDFWGTMAVGPR